MSATSDDVNARVRELLASGDDLAWRELDRLLTPWLTRFVRAMLGSADDADDVVQRVLVTLWQRHGSITGSVLGWLRATARNETLDLLKSPRYRRMVSTSGAAWDAVLSTDPGQDADDEVGAVVALALEGPGLSREVHETFLLRVRDGFSYEEIATLQGITVGAAKMRVLRARDVLRQHYHQH